MAKKFNGFAQGEISVWNDIYTIKAESDILIVGSSRTWVQFDPAIIELKSKKRCYNLGLDGHNFYLQNYRLQEYLKRYTLPETIIFSVDMFTLQKRKDLYNKKQFLPYMFWNFEMKKYLDQYEGFHDLHYYLPLARYAGDFISVYEVIRGMVYVSDPAYIKRNKGYMGQEKEWNQDLDKAKNAIENYKVLVDSSTLQLFIKEVKWLKDKGVKILFVYPPEYLEGQRFVSNRAEVMTLFSDISNQLNVRFLDYSSDSISSNKSYFYNASHLNKKGATIFSQKFALDLNQHLTYP